MRCPKCECLEDKVIDSRSTRGDSMIRRRRECLKCGNRFTTYENIETREKSVLKVLKRDGSSQDFSVDKLKTSMERACYKRPVGPDTIRDVAERIESDLESKHDGSVSYREIGERVMNELRALDKVAYIRYASIYRQFAEPDEFLNEIKKLEKPHDTLTIGLPGV